MWDTSASAWCTFYFFAWSELMDLAHCVGALKQIVMSMNWQHYTEMNELPSRTLISNRSRMNGNLSSKTKQIPDRTRSLWSQNSAKILLISWKIGKISPQTDETCKVWLTLPGQSSHETAIPHGVTSISTKSGKIMFSLCSLHQWESNSE